MATEMKEVFKNKKLMDALLAGFLIVVALIFLVIVGVRTFGKPEIFSADTDKIMNEHPALQEAMEKFQAELIAMQKKLDEMEGEEKAKEQQRIQQQVQQIAMRMQKEAVDKVMQDIRTVAKKKGYDYIVDSKSLIVGGKDVTEEILSSFKSEEKKTAEEEVDPSVMPMIPVK
jgi:Skp family chaperone for outer membrane proteins